MRFFTVRRIDYLLGAQAQLKSVRPREGSRHTEMSTYAPSGLAPRKNVTMDAQSDHADLRTATSRFSQLLGIEDDAFAWLPQELGSTCGDAVRYEYACNTQRFIEEALIDRIDLDWRTAATIVAFRSELRPLFTTAQLVWTTPTMELVHTRPLRCERCPESFWFKTIAALAVRVDSPEDHGFGFHLHPTELSGKHLGYKLLFDPARGQSQMSWEKHGQGKTPWKDPARETLGLRLSQALHHEALRSVRGSRIAPRGTKFATWAGKFERPGKTAFYAAPHSPQVRPWVLGAR